LTTGHTCPDRQLLASLLLGTLPPEQEEAVNRHLDDCPACAAAAEQVETTTDPLIDALRRSKTQGGSTGGPPPDGRAATLGYMTGASYTGSFQLEGFRILREVCRGGMGVVFYAVQSKLDRPVAIKMILAGRLAGPEERVRFLMEGGLLARLNHPNFVQVYEVGTVEASAGMAQPYLVLEYVDGGNLRAELAGKPRPARRAAEQVLVLARAIEAAHAQGVVHRDLKPANVLIAGDGTLKISDFGLAKDIGTGEGLTPSGITLGTPEYMAPEQARADRTIGPAVDIYALGAILYEMLTGRPPFTGNTPVEIILKVLDQVPTSPSQLRPGLSRDLATICRKCLEKEPRARYARAADLADDLSRWLDGRPIRARPVGRVERAVKWARRHPLPAALAALVLISFIAGSAISAYFGVTATRRADETRDALSKEADARRAADGRNAELQLANGLALADAGEVDRGLFVMLRALESAPAGDADLRRAVQLNLEAWLPSLPRLRWFENAPVLQCVYLDDEILVRRGNELLGIDPATGRTTSAARVFPGLVDFDATGRQVCIRADHDGAPEFQVLDRLTGGGRGAPIIDRSGAVLIGQYKQHDYRVAFTAQPGLLCRELVADETSPRCLWDLTTGREIGPEVVRPAGWPARLLATRDRGYRWLFLKPKGQIELVDPKTGESRGGGPVPADIITPPDLFPNPTVLQERVNRNGLSVELWDVAHGSPVQLPWRVSHTTLGHRITADGRRLVGLSLGERITWFDLARQQASLPTAGVGTEGGAYADLVVPSPTGRSCLFAATFGKTLKRIDFPRLFPAHPADGSGETRFTVAPPRLTFSDAVISPDRSTVLFGAATRTQGDPYARLVEAANGRPIGLPLTDFDILGTFSPSGRLVALATWDGSPPSPEGIVAQAYDAHSGRPRGPAFALFNFIHVIAFSPDERMMAVGRVAGLQLCDLETGDSAMLKQPGPITRLLFSRDGHRVALCSRSGWTGTTPGVAVWDVKSARQAGKLIPMNDAPFLVPTDEGDSFLTIERDTGRVRRWAFAAAGPVEELDHLAGWPTAPRDHDGWTIDLSRRRLAFASSDGTVYLWDLRTGRKLAPDAQFGRPIVTMEFSPDGRWLAVAGENGEVALFDPQTSRRAGPLLTIGVPIRAVAFTSNSAQLLTASVDGRVTRWDLGKPQPLDPEQWRTWLEAATGMRLEGDRLVPLTYDDYRDRLEAARLLPTPLGLPDHRAEDWDAEEARDAAVSGQLNSARWRLDRWIERAPTDWLPLARRARISALEGKAEAAKADLDRATKLCADDGLYLWRRHEAATGRLTGQRLTVLEAEK
jgi:hypothetical protein